MNPLFDLDIKEIRPAAILTTSYVAGTIIDNAFNYNSLQLFISFTIGSLTDAQIKVEFSLDGTTYFQHSYDSVAAGVNTITPGVIKLAATGKPIYTLPINTKYVKVSSIGTGTVTGSSLAITAVMGRI